MPATEANKFDLEKDTIVAVPEQNPYPSLASVTYTSVNGGP